MRSRPSFAETLDEALGVAQDDTPREAPPPADRFVYLPVTAAPFVFVYSRLASPAAMMGAPAAAAPAARARAAYQHPDEPARRSVSTPPPSTASAPAGLSRALTPRQQRAFDAMTALGARLRGDFEVADLRRAFRRLANEYHPDRHPTSTPTELEYLSRTFADLSEHYRCLLALFDGTR